MIMHALLLGDEKQPQFLFFFAPRSLLHDEDGIETNYSLCGYPFGHDGC